MASRRRAGGGKGQPPVESNNVVTMPPIKEIHQRGLFSLCQALLKCPDDFTEKEKEDWAGSNLCQNILEVLHIDRVSYERTLGICEEDPVADPLPPAGMPSA